MASGITFLPEYRFDLSRYAVAFHAEQDEKLILCRISIEALQDAWPREQSERPEDTFASHRAEIEAVARELISRQRFETDGTVGIRSEDVRHLAR